ncbi:MAG TPA: cytochrome c assembly protein, partial [Saprospiraceae bacterium]|nr:cytochrome c assembly protein [Saprospiraceae bacterium]
GTPIMEINGNQVLSPKVYLENAGTIVAFTHLDPQTEKATFEFNLMFVRGMAVPLKIAENSLRSDYIVLEAVIFPGINFFWSGSLMMMLGLLLSMYNKIRLRRAE